MIYYIMRPIEFHAKTITQLLEKVKISTLVELKKALGTSVTVTVFRKLKALAYRTSYSHRGSYYTLDRIARFNERGLWSVGAVQFSKYGTLLATAEAFVCDSDSGYSVIELEEELGVSVQEALLTLLRRGRITREQASGKYLYCSLDISTRREQLLSRHLLEQQLELGGRVGGGAVPDKLKTAMIVFYGLLNEKQRRLYAGFESLKWGHGGDRQMAELLKMDAGTVARGRRELLRRDMEIERVRQVGAGRTPLEKKRRRSSPKLAG